MRREDAAAIVQAAGGDVVVTDGNDLATRVAEATGGAEIRLGIDAVGGTATGRLADCLSRDAILVNYGRMSGEPCTVPPDAFVFRNLTLRGFWLASWFRTTPEVERAALLGEIADSSPRARCTRRFTPPTTSARSRKQSRWRQAAADRARS